MILDTNVVFDWLLFDDPTCQHIARAIESHAVDWIGTQAMADEADHVLGRGTLDAWQHRHDSLHALRASTMRIVPDPPPLPLDRRLRCSDTDDQKFIDLAMSYDAACLLTRDNALLALRRRAERWRTRVLRPADWPGRNLNSP